MLNVVDYAFQRGKKKTKVVDYHAIWLDGILYQNFYDLNIFNLGLCSNAIISMDKCVKPWDALYDYIPFKYIIEMLYNFYSFFTCKDFVPYSVVKISNIKKKICEKWNKHFTSLSQNKRLTSLLSFS